MREDWQGHLTGEQKVELVRFYQAGAESLVTQQYLTTELRDELERSYRGSRVSAVCRGLSQLHDEAGDILGFCFETLGPNQDAENLQIARLVGAMLAEMWGIE